MNKRQRKKTGKRSVRNVEDMINEQETQVNAGEQAADAQAGAAQAEGAANNGCGCGCGQEAGTTEAKSAGSGNSKCGCGAEAGKAGDAMCENGKAAGTDTCDKAGTGKTADGEACGKADAGKTADGADGAGDAQIDPMKAEYEAKIAKLTDQLKRNMAEFDNYRKRTEQEKLQMFDRGVSSVAEKILPTIDNFDRAMTNEPTSEEAKAFVSGMELVYKSFMKALEDIGIKPIECVGKEFDPNLHHAVMHEDDDSGEQNIITEEFQKGYTLKDKVIRCSMVKVKN